VYIICQNEEKHIERVLESVKDFDEIIIVDSGSTDSTLEIVSEYTDKIYHQDWLGYAGQKEYAKNLCSNEWVLNLDADEELTQELKDEIVKTIQTNDCDGLDIKISGKYLDSFGHSWCKFNRRIRFLKKSHGHYPQKLVHESIVINGKIKKAKGFIFDYGTQDLETQLHKINLYSSLRAKEKFEKNKKPSVIKLLFVFLIAFLKTFVVKRSFLNGLNGYIGAINVGYYAFLKEAKLYEIWKENDKFINHRSDEDF
jgi:glycosyltransferase involved in cell wall biosynthesis